MTASAAAVPIPINGRPHRRRTMAIVVIAVVLVLEVALSLGWPHVVPRLAVLPQPPEVSWDDGCNTHHRYYVRTGVIWGQIVDSTVVACDP